MVDALSQIDRPDTCIYRIRQPRQLATFPPLSHSTDYFAIESVTEKGGGVGTLHRYWEKTVT